MYARAPVFLLGALALGCADAAVLPPTPQAARFEGAAEVRPGFVSDTIIVRVTGELGRPVPDVEVTWSTDAPLADVFPVDARTDHDGRARALMRGGLALDRQRVQVRVADLDPVVRELAVEAGSAVAVVGLRRNPADGNIPPPTCVEPSSGPVRCSALSGPWHALDGETLRGVVAAGSDACGLTPAGRVRCLASGASALHDVPGDHPALITLATGFVGFGGTCGLDAEGRAWCWGRANERYLQAPLSNETWEEIHPLPTDLRFRQLTVSSHHACGVVLDGAVWCWGNNDFGQLGTGPGTGAAPRAIEGLPRAIAVHSNHTDGLCSLGVDRIVRCWGDPFADGLGRDEPTFSGAFPMPQPITRVGRVRDIQPTGHGWAALDDDGRLHLWGRGVGGTGWRVGSPHLFGPGASFRRLATWPPGVACALDDVGRAVCVDTQRAIAHLAFDNLDASTFRDFWGVPPL